MKSKPWRLRAISTLLLAVSAGLPLQIAWEYGMSATLGGILSPLTLLSQTNWMLMMACALTSILVWKAASWAVPGLLVVSALLVYNNVLVALAGTNATPTQAALATAGFFALLIGLLDRETRDVLTVRTLQWWRSATRLVRRLPVRVTSPDVSASSRLFSRDISSSGVFVDIEDPTRFPIGSRHLLQIRFSSGKSVELQARVIRHLTSHPPRGVALRYDRLGPLKRFDLEKTLREERQLVETTNKN